MERWLASRLDALSGEDAPDTDERPTSPGAPPRRARPARGLPPVDPREKTFDEGDDDHETVRMSGAELRRMLGDDADAKTARVRHMPVAFISEAVFDPETAHDVRIEARRWRDETQQIDEIVPTSEESLEPHAIEVHPHVVRSVDRTPEPYEPAPEPPQVWVALLAGAMAAGTLLVLVAGLVALL